MPDHTTLAAALLLDARHRAGLTQAELAERVGVARPLISKYERGRKDPSITTLARLLAAMGMELRLHAEFLTPADIAQYTRDAAVGSAQGRRNAEVARRTASPPRRVTAGELAKVFG
jgi:transcriptional regulator with XRE-family HTH domain